MCSSWSIYLLGSFLQKSLSHTQSQTHSRLVFFLVLYANTRVQMRPGQALRRVHIRLVLPNGSGPAATRTNCTWFSLKRVTFSLLPFAFCLVMGRRIIRWVVAGVRRHPAADTLNNAIGRMSSQYWPYGGQFILSSPLWTSANAFWLEWAVEYIIGRFPKEDTTISPMYQLRTRITVRTQATLACCSCYMQSVSLGS